MLTWDIFKEVLVCITTESKFKYTTDGLLSESKSTDRSSSQSESTDGSSSETETDGSSSESESTDESKEEDESSIDSKERKSIIEPKKSAFGKASIRNNHITKKPSSTDMIQVNEVERMIVQLFQKFKYTNQIEVKNVYKKVSKLIKQDYFHKDFVRANYVLNSELSVVNALVNMTKKEQEIRTNEELFNKLSNKYKAENKTLLIVNNFIDTDNFLKVRNKYNNIERTYIQVHLEKTYKTFYQLNKRSRWFYEIVRLINNDLNLSIDFILKYFLKHHIEEFIDSLYRSKLLN